MKLLYHSFTIRRSMSLLMTIFMMIASFRGTFVITLTYISKCLTTIHVWFFTSSVCTVAMYNWVFIVRSTETVKAFIRKTLLIQGTNSKSIDYSISRFNIPKLTSFKEYTFSFFHFHLGIQQNFPCSDYQS